MTGWIKNILCDLLIAAVSVAILWGVIRLFDGFEWIASRLWRICPFKRLAKNIMICVVVFGFAFLCFLDTSCGRQAASDFNYWRHRKPAPTIRQEAVGRITFSYYVEDGGATVSSASPRTVRELEIPETLGGFPVVAIGGHAFALYDNLETVIMPPTISKIGLMAFAMSGITHIAIPRSVSEFDWAFTHCERLRHVEFRNGITEISNGAFDKCVNLETVIFPPTITEIGNCAFANCSHLESLDFPPRLERIGRSAFEGCIRLRSVTFPASLREIGSGAFWDCEDLSQAQLPYGLLDISRCAFAGCPRLPRMDIPGSVTNVGAHAFDANYHIPPEDYEN